MTIILKIRKYDNLQYDNYFEKIVLFEFQNLKKKAYDTATVSAVDYLSKIID